MSVQLKKGIRNLQHQNMRMVMLMTDQHSLARAPHAILVVVFFESPQSVLHRWVFLGLRLFRAESVVAEWVQSDGGWLFVVEGED